MLPVTTMLQQVRTECYATIAEVHKIFFSVSNCLFV
jgi:hypothetical protein